jgi:hypothetical protein
MSCASCWPARSIAIPKLKLIIGHMGEMLPMMLARDDEVFRLDIEHLGRSISRTILDQVWITTSGIFTEPPLHRRTADVSASTASCFPWTYPYAARTRKGRSFLDRICVVPRRHGQTDARQR